MNQIGQLAKAILDGDLYATIPLLDALKEARDPRVKELEDAIKGLDSVKGPSTVGSVMSFKHAIKYMFQLDMTSLKELLDRVQKDVEEWTKRKQEEASRHPLGMIFSGSIITPEMVQSGALASGTFYSFQLARGSVYGANFNPPVDEDDD